MLNDGCSSEKNGQNEFYAQCEEDEQCTHSIEPRFLSTNLHFPMLCICAINNALWAVFLVRLSLNVRSPQPLNFSGQNLEG